MIISQVIDVANKRTEQRGAKKLDMDWEFYTVLQDLCSRKRWYWRKKRYTFNTSAAAPTYDLSSDAIIASAGGVDIEEIIKDSVFYIVGTNQVRQLNVIFEASEQTKIIRDTRTGTPELLFIEPGTNQTVRVGPIPSGVCTIDFMAWAMPNGDFDAQTGAIPLVPKFMHPVLVQGLEAQILKYTAGDKGSVRYIAAARDYEAGIAKFFNQGGISGETREFADTSGEAVQST